MNIDHSDLLGDLESAAPGERDAGSAVPVVVHKMTPVAKGGYLEPHPGANRPQADPVPEHRRLGQRRLDLGAGAHDPRRGSRIRNRA